MISRSITSEDLIEFNLYLLNHLSLCLNLDEQFVSQLKKAHKQRLIKHKYHIPQIPQRDNLCFYNFITQQPIIFSCSMVDCAQQKINLNKAEEILDTLNNQELKYINNPLLNSSAFSINTISNNIYLFTLPYQDNLHDFQYLIYQLVTKRNAQRNIINKILEWDFEKLLKYYSKQLNFLESLQQHPRFQRLVDHYAHEDANMWNKGLTKLKYALPLLLEQELIKLIREKKIEINYTPSGDIIFDNTFWSQLSSNEILRLFKSTLKELARCNLFKNATITFIEDQVEKIPDNLLPESQKLPYLVGQPDQFHVAYSTQSLFSGVTNFLTIELLNDSHNDISNWVNSLTKANTQENSLQRTLNHCLGLLLKNLEFRIYSNQNVYGVKLISHRVLHLVTLKQHIEFDKQLDYENYFANQYITDFAREHFNKYITYREPTKDYLHGIYNLMRNKHKSKLTPKVCKSNITLTPQNVTRSPIEYIESTIPSHLKTWRVSTIKSSNSYNRDSIKLNYPQLQTVIEDEFTSQLIQEYANKTYLEEALQQSSTSQDKKLQDTFLSFDQLQTEMINLPMRSYFQSALNLIHESVKKSLFLGVNVFEASTAFLSFGWLYETILHHLTELSNENVVKWDANFSLDALTNNLHSLRNYSSLLFLEPNKNYKHLLIHEFKQWLAQNDNLHHNYATDLQSLAVHFDVASLKPQDNVFTYLTNHSGIIYGLRMELLGVIIELEVVNPHRVLSQQNLNYNHPFASHTLEKDEYVTIRTIIKPTNYIEARIVLGILFGKQEIYHPTFGIDANYEVLSRGLEICDTVRITNLDILRKNVTSYLPNTDTDFTTLWNSL